MKINPVKPDQWSNAVMSVATFAAARKVASFAAAICLLVAPFRGATGWRAGLLVLAFLLIVAYAFLNRHRRNGASSEAIHSWLEGMPRSIVYTTAAWALALLIGSLLSDNPWRSLGSWKGDVLTPLLALVVFYMLTLSIGDARRWLLVLFLGLIGLTGTAIFNLFVPVDAITMPAFGGIGAYSTWLITLCSLLPIAWSLPISMAGKPVLARSLTVIAIAMMLISAFLTTNRAIWICFGILLIVFAALSIYVSPDDNKLTHAHEDHSPRMNRARAMIMLVIAGGMVFTALFFAANEMRFNGKPPGGGGTVEMITHDNRGVIWKEALTLIAAKPLTGYGYGREIIEETMSARFTEPLDKALFIQGHNIVLNQLLQIGVVGAVLLLAMFASLFLCFARMLRGNAFTQTVGLCGVLLVVGVFARNMVDDFFIRQNAILFWAIVGMLLGLGERHQNRS